MKQNITKQNITKVYIYSNPSRYISETDAFYVIASNRCYPTSLKRITKYNFIATIKYPKYEDLIALLQTKETFAGSPIIIRRIFKSIKLYKSCPEPKESFLKQVILGISGLMKKPVDIKVVDTRASKWALRLTQKWQKEYLDKPEIFEKVGIKNYVDINKAGKLRFVLIKTSNYILTYFDQPIDKYVIEE